MGFEVNVMEAGFHIGDEGIIDEEKKVRHSKLAEKTDEVITNPQKINVKLKVCAHRGGRMYRGV